MDFIINKFEFKFVKWKTSFYVKPSYAVPMPFWGSMPTGLCRASSQGHGQPEPIHDTWHAKPQTIKGFH